jgi:PAS domain S-box-containing protein
MLRSQQWWQVTLASVGDAVLATDTHARIVFLNSAAEHLTGWSLAEAQGRAIGEVFVILNERTRSPAENPALRALVEGRLQGLANHTILIARDGTERGIDDSAAPIRDDAGVILGVVLVFRDVTQKRKADRLRAARLAVAQILSEGGGVQQPVRRLVEALPRALGWDGASVWLHDSATGELVCRAAWASPESGLAATIEAHAVTPIVRGEGLVGRVWDRGTASWLGDGEEIGRLGHGSGNVVVAAHGETDLSLPMSTPAPRAALAAPLVIEGKTEGVLALWSRARQQPDDEIADTIVTLANQIGDVIQRRRMHNEIRRREAELEDFFRSAVVGLHWVGPDGIIQRANRAELHMLGYSEQEYVGHHVAEFHVDPEPIADVLDRLRRGEEVRDQEVRLRARDGSIRHVVLDANALWDEGRFVHARCFTRDITDRKNTEINLRFLHQSSQTLAELVDYRTTLERIAQLAVPDFADWCTVQILGADGFELVAWAHRDPARSQLVREAFERHPIDPDSDYGIAQVLRTGRPELVRVITDEMLVRVARTESHLRLLRELRLSSSMTVPFTARKGVRGTLRFVATESGRRYTEEDLETATDLARQASIAIDNALMFEESREADRRKDEFLATLAHELRNPLAPIRSAIDLLALDPEAREQTVALMRRQLDHLVRLADDLLDISRITHGKVELRREVVQLSGIVEAAVAAVRTAADEKRHRLKVAGADESIWLDADPVRVLQVLENLLSNAVKYTHAGGHIEVSVGRDDGFAAVTVRDDGIGIDADLMAQIFEPFTQASSGFDRPRGGLGIGLTLVRQFTEMHGGTVSVSSGGRDRGSEFVVRWPIASPPQEKTPPVERTPRGPSTGRRVLVVDDNEAAATMLALLLDRLGAQKVDVATDGAAAVTKARELLPDVVLLDIGLPGMDGYQVARELRRWRELDRTVLVALTGYGQEQDRLRSREAGFDEHLVKPASVDDLQRVLSMTR